MNKNELPLDLGQGLVLRRAKPKDGDRLAAFNDLIHFDPNTDPPGSLGDWTRDLMSGRHPTFSPELFCMVENTASREIVSAMCLIPQTWSYAGLPFSVGRPELVGTLPAYRNRGLVRQQFEQIHAWSRQRGDLLLGITGIPYYYRLFGYEPALQLGYSQIGTQFDLPRLAPDQVEPFVVRPAQTSDLPLIQRLYQQTCQRSLVSCQWSEAQWLFELNGKSPNNLNRGCLKIIERSTDCQPAGFYLHPFFAWDNCLPISCLEIDEPFSYQAVLPSLLRAHWQTAQALPKPPSRISLRLQPDHPAYSLVSAWLPQIHKPYAWQIAIPDLAAFLRHIAPVLETRLAASACRGYSGQLRLNFYRSGLCLTFVEGRFKSVELWQPAPGAEGDAAFPDRTFLQLLLGYRSLPELEYAFFDASASQTARPLLSILFPKQASCLTAIS
jgi:hypothetical protein